MSRIYDKPILIQRINEITEEWEDLYNLHARVNKKNGDEAVNAGAVRYKSNKTFEVRYFKDLADIDGNTQSYRIVYKDRTYNITDYDDYMEQHLTVTLVGELYG